MDMEWGKLYNSGSELWSLGMVIDVIVKRRTDKDTKEDNVGA